MRLENIENLLSFRRNHDKIIKTREKDTARLCCWDLQHHWKLEPRSHRDSPFVSIFSIWSILDSFKIFKHCQDIATIPCTMTVGSFPKIHRKYRKVPLEGQLRLLSSNCCCKCTLNSSKQTIAQAASIVFDDNDLIFSTNLGGSAPAKESILGHTPRIYSRTVGQIIPITPVFFKIF